jgi:hypothetical protein
LGNARVTGTSVDRKAVDTRPIPRNLDLIFVYETSFSFSFDQVSWA